MKIKIIGIENTHRKDLEVKVKNSLKKLSFTADIQIISVVDDILKCKIEGIPALVIDKKVLFQVEIPEENLVYNKLNKVIKRLKNNKKTTPVALGT